MRLGPNGVVRPRPCERLAAVRMRLLTAAEFLERRAARQPDLRHQGVIPRRLGFHDRVGQRLERRTTLPGQELSGPGRDQESNALEDVRAPDVTKGDVPVLQREAVLPHAAVRVAEEGVKSPDLRLVDRCVRSGREGPEDVPRGLEVIERLTRSVSSKGAILTP